MRNKFHLHSLHAQSQVLATVRVTIIYDDRPICNSDSCRHSPRKRAKIGAYATKHGAATAAKHFSKQLGHSVKESTVKLIRNAYRDASNKEIKVTGNTTLPEKKRRVYPFVRESIDKQPKSNSS